MNRYLRWLQLSVLVLVLIPAGLQSTVQREGQGKVPERSQIDPKYTWNLADMYPSREAWESDFKACQEGIDGLTKAKGTVTRSPEALQSFLGQSDDLSVRFAKVAAYASLLRDQDTRQAGPQAIYDRVQSLRVKLEGASSWFQPEILALPDGKLKEWCKGNPKLAVYAHYFENLLRQKPHVLSTREEELMAMTGKLAATPRETFSMLADADMKFPTIKDDKGNDVQLSEGRYTLFMRSADRALRERAFKQTLGAYLAYKNTLATTLAGSQCRETSSRRAPGTT